MTTRQLVNHFSSEEPGHSDMAFVKFQNGVTLTWDDTISVGTLIRTYNSGYHILHGIQFRDEPKGYTTPAVEWSDKEAYPMSPLFHYTKVLKDDGTKSKAIVGVCDASYCSRVTEKVAANQLATEILAARDKYAALQSFIDPNYKP